MKRKINMVGGGFQHDICSSAGHIPKYIEWVKNPHEADISIHIDFGIINNKVDISKKNYAWLAESKTINKGLYEWCSSNIEYIENNFELLFTHDKHLLGLSDKFVETICGAKHWVKNVGIHNKTKLISMISSTKNMCPEHSHRQTIVNNYRNKLDLYGRGYNEINNKEIGLIDYHFSIAMENHTYDLAYSEKLTDCFATGTIPIYYGSKLISEICNVDGVIMLDNDFNIDKLTPELYNSKIDAIYENYNIAINMPVAEDYIYEKYIKNNEN